LADSAYDTYGYLLFMSQSKGSDQEAINPDLVRQLATILKETDLTEIEVEQGHLKIKVARQIQAPSLGYSMAPQAQIPIASVGATPVIQPSAAPPVAENHLNAVTSPMVGTVYLQGQPGSPVFIKLGDTVKAGQTLLIIEAMKTMNTISAPRAGKITSIMVSDGQPVEFGAPLVVID
jgi:acetyl-CoA carboxylase biotin carboxyl carrier protein